MLNIVKQFTRAAPELTSSPKTKVALVSALAISTLFLAGCGAKNLELQPARVKMTNGEYMTAEPGVRETKTVTTTTVKETVQIPERVIAEQTRDKYKEVKRVNSCGQEVTAKVKDGKEVVVPEQIVPATEAVKETQTTVVVAQEQESKGGDIIGLYVLKGQSITEPNVVRVPEKLTPEGDVTQVKMNDVVGESDLAVVGGAIGDIGYGLGTAAMGGAAIHFAGNYKPEKTTNNNVANGGAGGAGGAGGEAWAEGGDAQACAQGGSSTVINNNRPNFGGGHSGHGGGRPQGCNR